MTMKLHIIAVVFLVAGTATVPGQSIQSPAIQISENNRTLSVSASDFAEADAEVAELHIGYVVYGNTLQDAYKSASVTSNAVIDAVIKAGAKRSDIQSGSQNVSRLNDYEMKQQKGAKFRVSQTWTVDLQPKDAAQVLDAAIQAGGNQSGDINWRMKNSTVLETEAVRRATERAHTIAVELAKDAGASLGKALYVTNNVSSGTVLPRAPMFAMAKAADSSQTAPLDVEPQRVRSDANVQIVYALQ